MARGHIFHVTTDPYNLGNMNEWDFCENLEALKADYVRNCSEAVSRDNTDWLAQALSDNGFDVLPDAEAEEDEREAAAFIIKTGDTESLTACKMRYFRPLLDALKKEVAALDLKEFATDKCNTYGLTSKINDDFSDAVYLDISGYCCTYTMHAFIRDMKPDMTYYVAANTVLMH